MTFKYNVGDLVMVTKLRGLPWDEPEQLDQVYEIELIAGASGYWLRIRPDLACLYQDKHLELVLHK